MQVRGVLFLNARAGSLTEADESGLRGAAEERGLRVVDVTAETDVASIVRDSMSAGIRSFIVAGGDGSIHHVAQSLVKTDAVLGIVPAGSVNHMARDLRLPFDWREALEVATRGPVRQIDTGRVNGRYFLNSVMLGIYPTLTAYREHFRTTHSKWRAYFRAARMALRNFPHVSVVVEIDGRVEAYRTQLFVVSVNSYDLDQLGLISLKTNLTDGRLSVYTLSFTNRWGFIAAAAKYFRGRVSEIGGFRRVRTRQLRVDAARRKLRISVDGELADLSMPLQIAAEPASLLVRTAQEQ